MTSDNITAMRQVVCPHCGAHSDPHAASCDACGGDLADRMRRESAQHAIPARVSSLWSATETAEYAGDPASVLARTRQAIMRQGGTVSEQSTDRLEGKILYRSGYNLWIPVSYDIVLSAIPAGNRRTSVRANATLDTGGSLANLLTIAVALLFILFTAGLTFVLIALVSIPAQKRVALKVARLVLDVCAAGSGADPRPAPPAPPPRAAPAISPPPSAKAEAANVDDAFIAIRRLAELRDMGAISVADFEAKKAELLRTI